MSTFDPPNENKMIYHSLSRSFYSPSSLFSYRNLDLVIKNTDAMFPFNFVKGKYDVPFGILPTTAFSRDDIIFNQCYGCLINSIKDNNKPFYRLDILYVGGPSSNSKNVVGFGNYDIIETDDRPFYKPFGEDNYSVGFVSNGGLRYEGRGPKPLGIFEWENGDTLTFEINMRDREVAFLRNHKLYTFIIKKYFPTNFVAGVFTPSQGVFFHVLFYGPVDSLEYLEILKNARKDEYVFK